MLGTKSIKNLSEISNVTVKSASGDTTPFKGWVEINFHWGLRLLIH